MFGISILLMKLIFYLIKINNIRLIRKVYIPYEKWMVRDNRFIYFLFKKIPKPYYHGIKINTWNRKLLICKDELDNWYVVNRDNKTLNPNDKGRGRFLVEIGDQLVIGVCVKDSILVDGEDIDVKNLNIVGQVLDSVSWK